MNSPSHQAIKQARKDAGLTQTEAGKVIGKALRTWQQWEAGHRKMDPALFELFTMKTQQNRQVGQSRSVTITTNNPKAKT